MIWRMRISHLLCQSGFTLYNGQCIINFNDKYMQQKEVRVDLKIARKKCGLLQRDLAELMGITQPRISRLEQGRSVLSVKEACALLVIYNTSMEVMFPQLSQISVDAVSTHITKLSGEIDKSGKHPELRQAFLSKLFQRLEGKAKNCVYAG